jgi:hypothetical protein
MNSNQGYAKARAALSSGTHGGQAEKNSTTKYDTQILNAANLLHRYFTNPVGSTFTVGGNKTLADTNVETANGMGANEKFTINSIEGLYLTHALLTNAALLAIQTCMFETTLTLRISGKDVIWQGTLVQLFGLRFGGVLVPTVAGDNVTGLPVSPVGVIKFRVPITLAANTVYTWMLEHWAAPDATLNGDKLKISLNGRQERIA